MTKDVLRNVVFRPYRKGQGPTFRLTMWDTHRTDEYGKAVLGYRLAIRDNYTGPGCCPSFKTTLFKGEDFHCAPTHAVDSDETVEQLMGFLTLRPGDTDPEYFKGYTEAQLAYCRSHAEALGCEVERRFGKGG